VLSVVEEVLGLSSATGHPKNQLPLLCRTALDDAKRSCQQRPKVLALEARKPAGASPEGRDLDEAAVRRVLPFEVLFYHPRLL